MIGLLIVILYCIDATEIILLLVLTLLNNFLTLKKKKTLVLGASLKPDRYSNFVINRLNNNGYDVVAFGMVKGMVNGISISTDLVLYKDVHTISLYLNANRQKQYYNYIVELKPDRVIFNPGTENPELYKILRENEIVFEVACTLVLLSTNQY